MSKLSVTVECALNDVGLVDEQATLALFKTRLTQAAETHRSLSTDVSPAVAKVFDHLVTQKKERVAMANIYLVALQHSWLSGDVETMQKSQDVVLNYVRSNVSDDAAQCEAGTKLFHSKIGVGGGVARWNDLSPARKAELLAAKPKTKTKKEEA